ncbi:MAG TPA: carboxypeptidase regulatory-like domain-containing protein [Bryobacteraceae bacterium]|nr:carboxypeptidase regulatory-like domain-containing protein [Bryobacteraceae bacterium]
MFSFFLAILCASILLVFNSVPAFGQAASGTIAGIVTDPSGAAVVNAEVKLNDPTTNSSLTTKANEVGRYTFANVSPGTYDLIVTSTGFTQSKIAAQKVDVGQSLTLNVTLQVGATSTVVEVQAAAGAELQTLNATIGSTIRNDQLQLLPNLGRDASTLSVLQVGVSLAGNVAGAQTDQNGFQLDGGNNSDDMAGTNTTYTAGNGYSGAGATGGTPTGVIPTPIESIEEFKVGTTGQTADFNGAAGSQIQMITKRGTNAFHGALYEFYYGSNVGAANLWRNNHTLVNGQATPLPATHRNRFGAAVGGPLTPKFWGGKTYFFVNYEGSRFPNVISFDHGTPTALMRAGVLLLPNTSGVNTPFNLNPFPVTVNGTTYQPATCGGQACDPRGLGINPLVQKLWSLMPLPNDPTFSNGNSSAGLVDGNNAQGYLGNLALPQTSNFIVGRIDHDFGEKWKFMSSYRYYSFSQLVQTQVDIGGLLSGATQGQYKSFAPRPVKPSYWVGGLTTTLTPNLTNDFRFSYLRNFWQWSTQAGPPQFAGLGGAVELGGESQAGSLIPYNVDSQDVRQRFWDGHDYFLSDTMSLLKGNHLLQFGGSYMRQTLLHGRDDNGVGINTSIVYKADGTQISTGAYTLPDGALPTYSLGNYAQMYNELMGIITQTQVMYSRSGANLQLNPLGTPGFDRSIVPTYDVYFSDTWHLRPTLTMTYGLGWALSMPPYEVNGKQVSMVDAAGNFIDIKSYMLNKQSAALQGQVYNPTIGFETIRNINGGTSKYPFNPFYGGFSPRVSLAWNPSFDSGILGAVVGRNKTVIRGGFARIYGRLNGVDLMLVPLLGPGLLQAVSCNGLTRAGVCSGAGQATPATAFRIGVDGNVATVPTTTATLPQPFYPGTVQNGVLSAAAADGSQLDPRLKPNHSDEFNFTIQRSLTSKMLVEAGYIGRKIYDEFQEINLDAVPWMTTLGGQSFAQAWTSVYNQICPNAGPSCGATAAAAASVSPQPFFEAAMGGPNSPYCTGNPNCTAAVVKNEVGNIRTTAAYQTWLNLSQKNGWTLGRTLLAQPGTGQQLTGAFDYINSLGHGNYNAAFVAFTVKDFHGLTARSNFTFGRALGTGSVTQSSSSITVPNPYDFNTFGSYGVQPFDIKVTYSLLMLYQPPIMRTQKGILGHILGGWTFAPLFTARSGQPMRVSVGGNAQAFGEIYSGQSANYEEAAGNGPFTGGNVANYNVPIPTGSSAKGVASSGTSGVNLFADPLAVYNEFRRPLLGQDMNSGGAGVIRGFPFWNLDATISKDFRVTEQIGATLSFQFVNILNHFVPLDPGAGTGNGAINIDTPSSWGVVTNQYTTPNGAQNRSMEFGLRIRF